MQVEQSVSTAEPVGTLADIVPLDSEPAQAALRPLKICILGYRSAPYGGGQGVYIKYLSKALVEAGHEVDVISGQPYPHLDPRVTLIKMPGMNLYETGLGSIRPHHLRSLTNIIEWTGKLTGSFSEPYCFGRRVFKYLQRRRDHYDIIHDNQCLSWGILKLQQRGFSLVTTVHHPITSDLSIALNAANNWRERLLIRRWHSFLVMQKKVARRLRHVVTVSDRSQRDIARAFGMDSAAINRIYCGIDINEFRPHPEITRRPYRLMATASADAPLKGLRYLLQAVALLVPQFPELELLLVGKPRPGGDTEKLIDSLGIRSQLKFVSGISTEQLVAYYAQAQVAVVPSIYEGFGLPAGEAMACGVPLVSTDGGALPEVVGKAAVIVPAADSTAMANAIAEVLNDPALQQRLAQSGRERIEQAFCWQKSAAQMVDFYRQVLESRRDYANG